MTDEPQSPVAAHALVVLFGLFAFGFGIAGYKLIDSPDYQLVSYSCIGIATVAWVAMRIAQNRAQQ